MQKSYQWQESPPVKSKTLSPHGCGESPAGLVLVLISLDPLQGSLLNSSHATLGPLSGLALRVPQPPLSPLHQGNCASDTSWESPFSAIPAAVAAVACPTSTGYGIAISLIAHPSSANTRKVRTLLGIISSLNP